MPCPEGTTLERLVLGLLPDMEAERWAQHLETCERCASTVQSFQVEDTLVAAARAEAPSQPPLETATVAALIERLKGLGPKSQAQVGGDESAATSADQALALSQLLAPPLEPGELGRLGPYRVLKVLGAGGMGVVFLAEDPQLRRPVALKTLQPTLATHPAARERFLREAVAIATIEDERIVPIYQIGEDRGIPFFAMQLLRGQTLEERLREGETRSGCGSLPVAEVVHIATEIARGLAIAHERGVIHRDVKPANIFLVGEGQASAVKLLDFGLARGLDDALSLTQPGAVVGTPAYVAPELLAGSLPDERCDLYGLGCVLYRMTTGKTGKTAKSGEAVPPIELNPALPSDLSELIVQLLSRDPARRPMSAALVADRLEKIADEISSVSIAPQPSKRRPRRWWPAAAAALIAGVILAAVYWVRTDRGEFLVEIDDPEVAVLLNHTGGLKLHDRKTDRTYTLDVGKHPLPSGDYEIDVRDHADKLEFSTPQFTIKRGDQTKVTVSLRGQPRAWLSYVAALPAQQRLDAVSRKLRDLNQGFDGHLGPRIEDGKLVEVHLVTDQVTDISPMKALKDLEILVVRGSAPGRGVLEDIGPVKSLPHLVYLDCSANKVQHLWPLRNMPLRTLVAWANPIEDLRPLAGMPLKTLDLNFTDVYDLTPLHKLPLTRLQIDAPYAVDSRPLVGLPLVELKCRYRRERHGETLKALKGLEKLNGTRPEEFWKGEEARRASLEPWIERVAKLPAPEQTDEVRAKLRELNPNFKDRVYSSIENDQVFKVQIFVNEITDIGPLRALTHLKRLILRTGNEEQASLYDFDPVRDLPIEFLNCFGTNVADLSCVPKSLRVLLCIKTPVRDLTPLRELPIFFLDCEASRVEDLTPLEGTGVRQLNIKGCKIKDLTRLARIPLLALKGDFDPIRDGPALRAIRSLETINDRPAANFLSQGQTK